MNRQHDLGIVPNEEVCALVRDAIQHGSLAPYVSPFPDDPRTRHPAVRSEVSSGLSEGRSQGYSSDRMASSKRKRMALSLLVRAITNRTRPCLEVSA